MKNLNTNFYQHKTEFIIICLLGFFVFFNSLFNPFIGDDEGQIIQNQVIHSVVNFPLFFTGGSFGAGGDLRGIYYKPILNFVFSIIYTLFGPTPFFFHLIQLTLHVINSILLYILFSKFLHRQFALFASLIFLIHPINAEAVIYISDMQEPLFFLFGMIGLLLIIKNYISIRLLYASQLFFLLSLFSKETGILFVITAFVYILFFKKEYLRSFILSSLCILSIYFIFRFLIGGVYLNERVLSPIMKASLLERILSIPAIFFYYIKTFFFPQTLLFSQQWVVRQVDFASFIVPLLFNILFFFIFAVVAFLVIKTSPKLLKSILFFSFWFLIGLILHSQLIPLDTTVSDRWFYFPIVGLLGTLALVLQTFFERITYARKNVIFIIIISLVSLLSLRTIIRNTNWFDPVTLYTHDISLMKPNFSLENALAAEYLKRKESSKALIHAQKSVDLFPTFSNLTNLGAIYAEMGDIQKGRSYYEKALQKGNFYLTYQNLAGISAFYDPPKEAKKTIFTYIKRFPKNSKLYLYLAIATYRSGNVEEAKKYTLYACKLSYDSQCRHLLYGIEHNLPIKKPEIKSLD